MSKILGIAVAGTIAFGGTMFLAQEKEKMDFLHTLSDLQQNGTTKERFVPSGSRKGLFALVELEGVDPTSQKGLAMVYETQCDPRNTKNLYSPVTGESITTFLARTCQEYDSNFAIAGVKSGHIQVHIPSDMTTKIDYK